MPSIPYVLSDDLAPVSRAFENNSTVRCPTDDQCSDYTKALGAIMKRIFRNVDIVSCAEMENFYQGSLNSADLPVVSLLPHAQGPLSLQMTRGVDETLSPLGLIARFRNAADPNAQINEIARYLKVQGYTEIALMDDVIYSGKSAIRLIEDFALRGLQVRRVYAAISIGSGKDVLLEKGVEVQQGRYYAEVVDEICARDFLPGAFSGGRTCRLTNGELRSVPYLKSFGGKADEWASIPVTALDFHASGCEEVAEAYWQEAQRLTGRSIEDSELPRPLLKGSITRWQPQLV